MKFWISALFLMLALACAPHNPPLTPAGQAALRADQVVLRLGELQDTAITANANGQMTRATAGKVVLFTVDGAKVAKASALGWQASLRAAWKALKDDIGLPAISGLGAVFALVDGLLGGA